MIASVNILSKSSTLELLRRLEIYPSRKLGQNFLVDANIVRKSLELAEIVPGDVVVEVGPGLGTLTAGLLAAGATVFAVEFDHRLASFLEGEFRAGLSTEANGRFHLLCADAVDKPRAGLPDGLPCWKVVANLPYAICSPWLEGILEGSLPQRMSLMLQLEAADRLLARPASKEFSALAVFLEGAYERTGFHTVSRTCFHPVPAVGSCLLALNKKSQPLHYSSEVRAAIRRLFTQRRKQLGGLCRGDDLLEAWLSETAEDGVSPQTRPEDVPMRAWRKLANRESKNNP